MTTTQTPTSTNGQTGTTQIASPPPFHVPAGSACVEDCDDAPLGWSTPAVGAANLPAGAQGGEGDMIGCWQVAPTTDPHGDSETSAQEEIMQLYISADGAGGNEGLWFRVRDGSFSTWTSLNAPPAATAEVAGLMSSGDKSKLDGISDGAEVNVQSDWNATSGDAYIRNKPSLAPSNAERNVQSDWNATSGDAYIRNKPSIPSGLSRTELATVTGTIYVAERRNWDNVKEITTSPSWTGYDLIELSSSATGASWLIPRRTISSLTTSSGALRDGGTFVQLGSGPHITGGNGARLGRASDGRLRYAGRQHGKDAISVNFKIYGHSI